jgi:hypothetical protein
LIEILPAFALTSHPQKKEDTMKLNPNRLCHVVAALAMTKVLSQASIVYFSGPAFTFQSVQNEPPAATLDLDQDGNVDFIFQFGYFICTADVPTSACSAPFYVLPSGTNRMLARSSQATVLPFGAGIGPNAPTNSGWTRPDQSVTVESYFLSPRYGTRGYGGPLTDKGVGYLGVRFYAADGLHYGWVRMVRAGPDFGPTVMDWAYETQPDTAVAAGLVDSNSGSRQFLVDFPQANGPADEPGGIGSLILTGTRLRCEITLVGAFGSAELGRVGPARAHSRPLASLGPPLVVKTNYTAFFRDVHFSRGDLTRLLRGGIEVTIDGGVLTGRISELK